MKNHFNNLKSKEFWKEELKKITFSDVLIWIAIFLMFMASWNNINAGKDPCSYCMIKNSIEGDISCREYFDRSEINLTFLESDNESIKDYGLGKTS